MGKKIISIMRDGVRYDLDESAIAKYSKKKSYKKMAVSGDIQKPKGKSYKKMTALGKDVTMEDRKRAIGTMHQMEQDSGQRYKTIRTPKSITVTPDYAYKKPGMGRFGKGTNEPWKPTYVGIPKEEFPLISAEKAAAIYAKFKASKKMVKNVDSIEEIIAALESMTPEEKHEFLSSLTPEQREVLDSGSGAQEGEEVPVDENGEPVEGEEEEVPVDENGQPIEGEEEEEVPVDENGEPVEGEEEVPVDEEGQPIEGEEQEVPVDEAGQPVAGEEEVPEEEVAQAPVAEEAVVEEQAKPLQVVCPHCKRPVTVSEEGPDNYSDQVPSALQEPEKEQKGNPY